MLKLMVCQAHLLHLQTKSTDDCLDIPLLISYYHALLSLLQKLCQTKIGATLVLNTGLFASIRESRLFAADPDIGIG